MSPMLCICLFGLKDCKSKVDDTKHYLIKHYKRILNNRDQSPWRKRSLVDEIIRMRQHFSLNSTGGIYFWLLIVTNYPQVWQSSWNFWWGMRLTVKNALFLHRILPVKRERGSWTKLSFLCQKQNLCNPVAPSKIKNPAKQNFPIQVIIIDHSTTSYCCHYHWKWTEPNCQKIKKET